tara:strand:+ start:212926 stop:213318 length:393 start_codon:yes stop_codon:yes gene_type:complete
MINGSVAIHGKVLTSQNQLTSDMGSHIKMPVKGIIPSLAWRASDPGNGILVWIIQILRTHDRRKRQLKPGLVNTLVANPVVTGRIKAFDRHPIPQLVADKALRTRHMLLVVRIGKSLPVAGTTVKNCHIA